MVYGNVVSSPQRRYPTKDLKVKLHATQKAKKGPPPVEGRPLRPQRPTPRSVAPPAWRFGKTRSRSRTSVGA